MTVTVTISGRPEWVFDSVFDAVLALCRELHPKQLGILKRDGLTLIQRDKNGVKVTPKVRKGEGEE